MLCYRLVFCYMFAIFLSCIERHSRCNRRGCAMWLTISDQSMVELSRDSIWRAALSEGRYNLTTCKLILCATTLQNDVR